jgi:hypothetical protein
MSKPSIARQLDRIQARPDAPTGDYFYDKLPAEQWKPTNPDEPDPRITSPWDKGTRAMRELRWHFSESAAELGERSAHESLIYRIQVGGGSGSAALIIDPRVEEHTGYRFQTARGPSDRAIMASEREGRIRAALKQLTSADYGDLAMTFSLRKPGAQILGLLAEADELLEPLISHMIRTGLVSVKALTSASTLAELVAAARARLNGALASYELAAGITRAEAAPRRSAPPAAAPRELTTQGAKGASKRRLVPREVPRAGAAA